MGHRVGSQRKTPQRWWRQPPKDLARVSRSSPSSRRRKGITDTANGPLVAADLDGAVEDAAHDVLRDAVEAADDGRLAHVVDVEEDGPRGRGDDLDHARAAEARELLGHGPRDAGARGEPLRPIVLGVLWGFARALWECVVCVLCVRCVVCVVWVVRALCGSALWECVVLCAL